MGSIVRGLFFVGLIFSMADALNWSVAMTTIGLVAAAFAALPDTAWRPAPQPKDQHHED